MPLNSSASRSPTVFISYAHESDALRASVRDLADWLGRKGCTVLTDHAHLFRPPVEGWLAWMQDCIRQAAVVLVVCSPKLKARYERTAPPDEGFGATYEGAIITQHIYWAGMRNDRFYPILPDQGSEADIPVALRDWWNGHRFPSGNVGIWKMIMPDPDTMGSSGPADGAHPTTTTHVESDFHRKKEIDRLDHPEAATFRAAVLEELALEFPSVTPPGSSRDLVRHFTDCDPAAIQKLFFVVRRGLETARNGAINRKEADEAAVALYCLAACRLVDRDALGTGLVHHVYVDEDDPGVKHVPIGATLICGVIATALTGLELRLEPSEEPGIPCPSHVYRVRVMPGSEAVVEEFERALHVMLFQGSRSETLDSRNYGALSKQQRNDLAARIRTIMGKNRQTLAVVIQGSAALEAVAVFADRHGIPVMLPSSEITSALVGMDAGRLIAEIKEFWGELQGLAHPDQPSSSSSLMQPLTGAPPMSNSGPNVTNNFFGNVQNAAVTTGDHSAAQAGTGHTANIGHREGVDLAELEPLARELLALVEALAPSGIRDKLKPEADTVVAEVVKGGQANGGVIKKALAAIKSSADSLEDGGKIIDLCHRAYQVAAPVLGLPPSPLP
jgi:hypothetical protein